LSDYATSSGKESGIKQGIEVLRERSIDESNAYLYVRGHNLYDIIVYIGKRCCSQQGLSFERDILKKDYPLQGYEETDLIQEDISKILG